MVDWDWAAIAKKQMIKNGRWHEPKKTTASAAKNNHPAKEKAELVEKAKQSDPLQDYWTQKINNAAAEREWQQTRNHNPLYAERQAQEEKQIEARQQAKVAKSSKAAEGSSDTVLPYWYDDRNEEKYGPKIEQTAASGINSWVAGQASTAREAAKNTKLAGYGMLPLEMRLETPISEVANNESGLEKTLGDFATDKFAKAAAYDAQSREGLGKFGNFMVDMGEQGTQLMADVATGVPLASMFGRSAGYGFEQARQSGASDNDELVYGLVSGAIEAATEKLGNFGPFKKYGKGLVDTLLKKMNGSVEGKSAMGWLASFGSEGAEEILSNILQVPLQWATIDPNAKIDWEDTLYQGLVGGAMGAVGGGVGFVSDVSQGNTKQQADAIADKIQNGEDLSSEELTFRDQNRNAVAQAYYEKENSRIIKQYADETNEFGETGQSVFAEVYDNKIEPEDYRNGFIDYYTAGSHGAAFRSVKSDYALSNKQKQAAYKAGKTDGEVANPAAGERLFDSGINTPTDGEAAVTEVNFANSIQEPDTIKKYGLDRPVEEWDETTNQIIDRLTKSLGLRVDVVDSISSDSGYVVNGFYSKAENKITIAKDCKNPVGFVMGHELTHRLQDLAPEAYKKFKSYVVNTQKIGSNQVNEIMVRYAKAGEPLENVEAAIDEVVADYAGDFLKDKIAVESFCRNNPKEAKTILEKLKAIWQSIKATFGNADAQMQKTIELWENALGEAQTATAAGVKTKAADSETEGGNRYSIKRDINGKKFVEVDRNILDGKTYIKNQQKNTDRGKQEDILRQVVAQKFNDLVDVNGQKIGINNGTAHEWIWSKDAKSFRGTKQKDKVRAFDNADELLQTANNYTNTAPAHWPRKDNFVNFGEGTIRYRYDGRGYEAYIIVGLDKNNNAELYDIINIEPIEIATGDSSNLQNGDGRAAKAVANYSIPNSPAKSNTFAQKNLDKSKQKIDGKASISRQQDEEAISQGISSAKTSIKQIPALFLNQNAEFKDTNIDIGGGKYDLATNHLAAKGTKNMVFDPYNRNAESNEETLRFLLDGNKADTATCANVLNVIAEPQARANVILETAKAIKPDSKAYFMVYEGDGTGEGKQTKAGYQNNRKTADYVQEIQQYFDDVERKGKLIIAKSPAADLPKAAWELTPGKAVRYSISKSDKPDKASGTIKTIQNVMSKQDWAKYYAILADTVNLEYATPQSHDGQYIIDVGDKLVYTDGNYQEPKVSKVIVFSDEYETNRAIVKGMIYDAERNEAGDRKALRAIEILYGKSYANVCYNEQSRSDGKQTGRRERTDISPDSQGNQERENQGAGKGISAQKASISRIPRETLDSQIEQYGQMKPGENPAREVALPKRTSKNKHVSQTVRNILEAKATPEELVGVLEEMTADEEFSNERYSNKEAVEKANQRIDGGFETAIGDWLKDNDRGKAGADHTALGMALYNKAVQDGNPGLAIDLAMEMVKNGHNMGQALQAQKILKRLTPEGQLMAAVRKAAKTNNDLDERYKGKRNKAKEEAKQTVKTIEDSRNAEIEKVKKVRDWLDPEFVQKLPLEINRSLGQIGLKMSDILKEGADTKEALANKIAAMLSEQYNVKPEDAAAFAKTVVDRFNSLVSLRSRRALSSRYGKKRAPEQKTVLQRITELANMGAFCDPEFAQKATKTIVGDLGGEIVINPEMAQAVIDASSDVGRDAALQRLYMDIGRQMPAGISDKLTAWRYASMLGNLRTNVRNVVGNTLMMGTSTAKNAQMVMLEALFSRDAKTTTINSKLLTKQGREIYDATQLVFNEMYDTVMGGKKYDESENQNKYIQEGRQIFPVAMLEGWRKLTGKVLEAEDWFFCKKHFKVALTRYCLANNISTVDVQRGKIPEKGILLAIKEAQENTFRDINQVSEFVSKLGRRRAGAPGIERVANTIVSAALPFRRTPANIAVRAVEYSPVGLAKTLLVDSFRLRSGSIDTTTYLNNIAKGMTGAEFFAVGLLLAKLGILVGGGDDDDKGWFDKLLGHQSYALEIGGKSFTIDWAAPSVVPLFMGSIIYEDAVKNGADAGDVLKAILVGVTDPIIEMTMMQGINNIFEDLSGFSDSEMSKMGRVLVSLTTSYLGQYVPTLASQIKRSVRPDERVMRYSGGDNFFGSDIQQMLYSVGGKIPGVTWRQATYVDAWGREQTGSSLGERLLNNMLNPSYVSDINESPMENELIRLYEATNTDVFPERPGSTITWTDDGVSKEKVLSEDEWVSFTKEVGQKRYQYLTALTGSSLYKSLSEDDKVDAVNDIQGYALARGKEKYSGYEIDGTYAKMKRAEQVGIPAWRYYLLRQDIADIGADTDANGKSIPYSKKKKLYVAINRMNLTASQKQAMLEMTGSYTFAKTADAPWR